MGEAAKPAGDALLKALDDPDPLVRGVAFQAVEALAPDLPDGALPRLIGHFPDLEAIRSVARYGARAKEAIPRLIELIENEDHRVRFQAVRALGKIGAEAIPQTPKFLHLMQSDPNDKVREISAEVLGQLGPPVASAYPQAVPALAKALKDSAYNVRRDAVRSLGQLGPAAKSVLGDVKAATKDQNEKVREAAERSVRQIEGSEKK
jgi:HEAT repeat protein